MKKTEPHHSTQRVIDILDSIMKQNDNGLTLTELAFKLDAPKSSLFPIVHTLYKAKLLNFTEGTSRYTIGMKAYEIGNAYLRNGSINEDIMTALRNISQQCSETCYFAELVDGDVFYLFKVDSPEPIRMFASPGKRLPAYSAGIGKALLSGKNKEEIMALYPDGLLQVTEHTITDVDQLCDQLAEIWQNGIAFECEESTPFIRCVAVPIKRAGVIRAAMSVAVPVFRYNPEKEALIIKLLQEARGSIENLLNTANWSGF